ncbi:MAG TPA: zf-TFIIB domain-containing protein, partial [Kofleriaceae bacterium]
MNVACSQCSHHFDGAGYRDVLCPRCGGLAQPRPCPRCTQPLEPLHILDLVIDTCNRCKGTFVDAAAKRLLAEHDHERAQELISTLAREAEQPVPEVDQTAIAHCPVCGVAMQRKLSATGAGVIIDLCRPHGTFFDAGEQLKIIRFVQREAERPEQRELAEYQQRIAESEMALPEVGEGVGGVGGVALMIL